MAGSGLQHSQQQSLELRQKLLDLLYEPLSHIRIDRQERLPLRMLNGLAKNILYAWIQRQYIKLAVLGNILPSNMAPQSLPGILG